MKTIGLVANPHKNGAIKLAEKIVSWLSDRGVNSAVEGESAQLIGAADLESDLDEVCESDMVIVLGGDGTILRAARAAAVKETPILGVHFGQYGFITEVYPPDVFPQLERVLEGDFSISERMMIKAQLVRDGEIMFSSLALNDVVVSKGPLSRMLNLQTLVQDRYITTYAADGIIMSTPTGSTAYSLSAGGPVVNPEVRVIIITPICPHTLNARSLVIPDDSSVQIIGERSYLDDDMMLTIDGQMGYPMKPGDKLDISRAEFSARIVCWDSTSFYDKLQSRLRWGERFST